MTARDLIRRGLGYYWRTNLAVIAGVATAVAVLSGALLVGDSVRGSLRDLVEQRLGRMDRAVFANGFFREQLATDLQNDPAFRQAFVAAAPLVIMQGAVSEQSTGRRASKVVVYGVDDRFWQFHGVQRTGPANRDAFVSSALATDIGAADGSTVLVRLERPSAIPIESVHGRKEDVGRTIRLTVRAVLDRGALGEFSIRPQQGDVRAVFVPLRRLQQDLEIAEKANAILVSDQSAPQVNDVAGFLDALVKKNARLEDYGLTLRILDPERGMALEADAGVIDATRSAAAEQAAKLAGLSAHPVFTYLANTIRSGAKEVPYSLVSATSISPIVPAGYLDQSQAPARPPIVLNDWTARDLGVSVGDPITLDYYVWQEPGILVTRQAEFAVGAIVPIAGAAADRDLSPVYPGITEADTLGDWDPPFPIDLKRVRQKDEDYWKQYRTTPKAFIFAPVGQELWKTRYGDRTSMRLTPGPTQTLTQARDAFVAAFLTAAIPAASGITARSLRADAVTASRGATNFGEYFVYFSFFLVVSALVLAALFFRLGVEQRAREVGLLRAVGYSTPAVRRIFAGEGFVLAAAGSVLGIAGAIGYGGAMMAGLRTWWSGAVGTTALTLHVSAVSLLAGAIGALLAAMGCIWWTLRGLSRISERSLLAGEIRPFETFEMRLSGRRVPARLLGVVFLIVGVALIAASSAQAISPEGGFFGAGASILTACLFLLSAQLATASRSSSRVRSTPAIGFRNTTERPGRSVLAVAVIASATFVLISVDAFRRGEIDPGDPHTGTGGYPLLVDLALPLVHDPNSPDGRDVLGLPATGVTVEPFRLLPGDDASCLNLYEPTNPRILGVGRRFIDAGRFAFQGSLAATDADRANPWRLLTQPLPADTIPVAADANSMTYVLHKSLGDEMELVHGDRRIRLKFVAALADSVFQSELLMSDENFVRLFPEQQGYRFLLIDAPAAQAASLGEAIERTAGDLGADATPAPQRLAEFHAVENTYLSTFQTLGGLGLLVGTIGLAAVLLRNILERRRELALLRAVGYGRANLFTIIAAENAVLLGCGLLVGAISAFIAIAPAALERGARVPLTSGGWLLLLTVLAAGLLSSLVATRAAIRAPLVGALRSE